MKALYSRLLQHKETLIAVALFFVIIVVLFIKMADGSHRFISPDSMSPKAVAQGMELAKEKYGEYPLWMPWMFSGLPSVHSFQYISRYYFPHHIFLMLKSMGMPWFWVFIFHIVFAGLGGYLLLKRLNLDVLSSFLGATAFMITPYMITMIVYGHGSQMMTAAYIPWIFWGLLKLEENPSLFNSGILALLLGLQLLRAHVQIAYYTWMMVGLFLLYRIIHAILTREYSQLKILYYSALSMILAMGVSMSIYYPVSQYTPFSIRGASGGGAVFDYATQWSFSFSEMMTFLIPSFLGFGGATYWGSMPMTDYPNYMGILILVFAVFGAIYSRNKFKYVLITTVVFSLLLSFGKHFFLYRIFFDYFPYFNKFRVPVMFLILTQFSVAVLAALGFNRLQTLFRETKSTKWCQLSIYAWATISGVLFLGGGSILAFFKVPEAVRPMIQADTFTLIVLTGLTLGLLFIGLKKWIKPSYVFMGIILFAVVDLTIIDSRIIDPAKDSGRIAPYKRAKYIRSYLRADDVINFLKKDTTLFRIMPLQYLENENRWSAFHIESVTGYHPAKLANYNQIISEVGFESPSLARMLNVKYLIHLQPIKHPDFKEVFKGNYYIQGRYMPAYVYEYSAQLPRFYFAESVRTLSDRESQISVLKQQNFDPVRTAFVTEVVDEMQYSANGSVVVESYTPDEFEVLTESEEDQFLVISEVYYPNGWNASIDGVPTTIYETNGVLRGVFVPEGNHSIIMRFQPDDIRIGNLISWISFTLMGFIILFGWYRNSKESAVNSQ
ncbi:MAG: YfhO family protein [Candidatus Marinimicrobia bacterium]|nr:YfhO family protein [Candidatus Neomarinimicrobiota bacterium]